ncbi:MAG: nucleotidyl transferase AbiEii/AbiGii toxin family protein [Bryobacteraceae bacterium]
MLEVQEHFGLPSPALVEKDWYVVKALAAIVAVDARPFRFVFSGGTALSRAHRLIRRMSEDIDLKIVSDERLTRPALRHLRDLITKALLETGFQFDPENPAHRESGNASRYTLYRLPYAPVVAGEGTLRPEIQIETAVWPLRRPAIELPVISFLAEAFQGPPEVATIPCVALVETVAEKFVALTRRAGAELADAGGPRDPTLVRHVYDLHMIRAHYDLAEVALLAREIMLADAAAYGHQFPAYRENPVAETLRAVAALVADPGFAGRYAAFQRDMVYGERVDFETAFAAVVSLAAQVEAAEGNFG